MQAKGKIEKAEKALQKVQDYLEPAELPTDLETLTDEERFLFRKIGLSMKPYLFLGKVRHSKFCITFFQDYVKNIISYVCREARDF